jgi:hypothetical protein
MDSSSDVEKLSVDKKTYKIGDYSLLSEEFSWPELENGYLLKNIGTLKTTKKHSIHSSVVLNLVKYRPDF